MEAENWVAWARKPGHDPYHYYSSTFFDEVVPSPNGPTLEIGCGEGRVTRDLQDRGHIMTAIDPSPTLIAHAIRADPASTYLLSAAEALPFEDSSFDLAVAYNSLMDVDDMPKAISEVARVLRPGGALCISVTHPVNDAGNFLGDNSATPFVIGRSYFDQALLADTVERDGLTMTFHSRQVHLEAYSIALEESGFFIECMREPRPTPEMIAERPGLDRWRRIPMFLFLRARTTKIHGSG